MQTDTYTYSDTQPVLYFVPSYAELKETTRQYIRRLGK